MCLDAKSWVKRTIGAVPLFQSYLNLVSLRKTCEAHANSLLLAFFHDLETVHNSELKYLRWKLSSLTNNILFLCKLP